MGLISKLFNKQACASGISAIAETVPDLIEYACKNNQLGLLEIVISSLTQAEKNQGLMTAVENGFVEIVKFLISNGASNLPDALTLACAKGDAEIVRELVSETKIDPTVVSTLESAVTSGNLSVVELLISNASPDLLNEGLYAACRCNQLDMVKMFIEKGAKDYTRALYIASSNQSMELIEYLLSLGSKLWSESEHRYAFDPVV